MSSCVKSSSGIVYTIDGHKLLYTRDPQISDVATSACNTRFDTLWTFTDGGETGTLTLDTTISIIDDDAARATLDAAIKAQSTKGIGLDGCAVKLAVLAVFSRAEAP